MQLRNNSHCNNLKLMPLPKIQILYFAPHPPEVSRLLPNKPSWIKVVTSTAKAALEEVDRYFGNTDWSSKDPSEYTLTSYAPQADTGEFLVELAAFDTFGDLEYGTAFSFAKDIERGIPEVYLLARNPGTGPDLLVTLHSENSTNVGVTTIVPRELGDSPVVPVEIFTA